MPLPRRYLPSMASLTALEALDRLGTATAAAQELDLTQSAVSRQLQVLEQQLGHSLIRRERKRLVLTDAGTSYARDIRLALSMISRASTQLHARPGTKGLSLAILPSFGMRWLVPRLPGFAAQYPEVPVNLATRLAHVDFDSDDFDAAIRYGNGHWTHCHSVMLAEEKLIPLCHPDLLPDGTAQTAAALSNMSLLHIETRPNAWTNWLAAKGAPAPLRSGALFDQFSTITQAARHGLGVALLPDFIAEDELAQGPLVAAFDGYTQSRNAYYLVWPQRTSGDPGLQLFIDWIITQTEDYLPR